jgi:proteic killer suppression protein
MIASFKGQGTEDIFLGIQSKAARQTCPEAIWNVARRKLDQLDSVTKLESLAIPRGNRLETLRGDREGQYSIRIKSQYRICFRWTEAGLAEVEITDYH